MGLPLLKKDRRYTYADLKAWPEDERWELIDGVAWSMSPAPGMNHQRICLDLGVRIHNFLKGKRCTVWDSANVLFPASPGQDEDEVDTVVEPDIFVVCDPEKIKENYCLGAPDWIIEVLSPSTSRKDMREKFDLYERSGVREYWIVDPFARYVQVYRLKPEGRYAPEELYRHDDRENPTITSGVLEGFTVTMGELFV